MSYSTKFNGHDGERVAYMSLDEWGSLDATQQAIEKRTALPTCSCYTFPPLGGRQSPLREAASGRERAPAPSPLSTSSSARGRGARPAAKADRRLSDPHRLRDPR